MNQLLIEKSHSTPEIEFSPDSGILKIRGESFPENAAKFYTPVFNWLDGYFNESIRTTVIEIEIIYFNSSTSKILLNLFDHLEDRIKEGHTVKVLWRCDKDNEIAVECGEEFKEDLTLLPFEIVIL